MRIPPLPLIAALLVLSGCTDPYSRAGTWHAAGVNQANLRAMLDDPGDMVWGVSEPGSDGQSAAVAVTRFRTGTVKVLSSDSISKVGGGGSSGSATPAAGAGATN